MARADPDVLHLWQQYVGAPAAGEEVELARSALVLAKLAYPAMALDYQLSRLNALAAGIHRHLRAEHDPLAALNTLSQYLFEDLEFRGNQDDYYDPRNSFLNDVLSRRLGIPITLSLLYIEVGRRAGMPLVGVGLPGHFLVGHLGVPGLYVDTFHRGTLLTPAECRARFHAIAGPEAPWSDAYLEPVGSRAFVARMAQNLKQIYGAQRRSDLVLLLQDMLVVLQPSEAEHYRQRGLMLYDMGAYEQALDDLTAYLRMNPLAKDRNFVFDLARRIRLELAR